MKGWASLNYKSMFRFHSLNSLLFAILLVCSPLDAFPQSRPSTQLLVVTTSDWAAVQGKLQRYERANAHGRWKAVGGPINVVVGKTGVAWGLGLRPTRGMPGPIKREGDGKAPAGMFLLSATFGYANDRPGGWKMPYIAVTPSVECIDDTHSRFYNRIVDRATVTPDWNSSEHMLLGDDRYRWGIVVDHNPASKSRPAVAGGGSCIFLHIWRNPETSTVGCTAMTQENLEALLAWLDPARQPLLVQLPEAQYKNLSKKWKLPSRRM